MTELVQAIFADAAVPPTIVFGEIAVVLFFLRVRGWDLLLVGLINCLTNPVVNLLGSWAFLSLPPGSAAPYLCLAGLEAAVVFGEALLFHKLLEYRRLHPLLLSLILNAASFAAGELVVLICSL